MSAYDGIRLSSAYLWQPRSGTKDSPTIRHIEALARFFDVSPAHFFDDEPTDPRSRNSAFSPRPRHRLPRASATSLVGLSDDSLDAVLQLTGRPLALEELPCASGVTGNDARNGRRHRKLRR